MHDTVSPLIHTNQPCSPRVSRPLLTLGEQTPPGKPLSSKASYFRLSLNLRVFIPRPRKRGHSRALRALVTAPEGGRSTARVRERDTRAVVLNAGISRQGVVCQARMCKLGERSESRRRPHSAKGPVGRVGQLVRVVPACPRERGWTTGLRVTDHRRAVHATSGVAQ